MSEKPKVKRRKQILPISFYARNTELVARELLGKILVRILGKQRLNGMIVETEAYHEADPASHSFRGKTPRNAPMFEEPGRCYVYFIYGNHFCLNTVTEKTGNAGAVLIRALEPTKGIEIMKKHRGIGEIKNLTSGPGKLCQALAIDRKLNRHPLTQPPLFILDDGLETPPIRRTTRIGIQKGADAHLRFYLEGNPFVSKS